MIILMRRSCGPGFTQHLRSRLFAESEYLDRQRRSHSDVSAGFTIAELMIATSVFSVILLVGAAAFVQLGRAYYRGVTTTQTQQTAKQIINKVSADIRLNSSVSPLGTASGSRLYYCLGPHRYSFILYKLVDSSNHDNSTNFGLLEDEPPGAGCGNPFDGSLPLVNPTEILGSNMRLLTFAINPVGSSGTIYSVKITVASGADAALTNPTDPNAQCQGGGAVTEFCSVTTLSIIVYEGVNI